MYDTIDGWDMEREAADVEQAELEAAGREYGRRVRRSAALRDSDPMAAARACPHGSGYPLNRPAAHHNNDPRAGEDGFRCTSCGSVLDGNPMFGMSTVRVPCEIEPA